MMNTWVSADGSLLVPEQDHLGKLEGPGFREVDDKLDVRYVLGGSAACIIGEVGIFQE